VSTVIAALDGSAAARPVLETALEIGDLACSGVEAVHVRRGPEDLSEIPASLAGRLEVPLRLLDGPAVDVLLAAIGRPHVVAAVIGARASAAGRRPVGTTARHLVGRTPKPIVVVPPDAVAPGPFRRFLVPLDGTEESSEAVRERLPTLVVADVDLVVLHVFTEQTIPAMLDQPHYSMEALGKEFLTRHLPHAERVELRPGQVHRQVAEVCRETDSDLVVLSWSQDSSPGRAVVAQEVLAASEIPVLLLPLSGR
jgi:nucleotide-binding universal stress UspA family protein